MHGNLETKLRLGGKKLFFPKFIGPFFYKVTSDVPTLIFTVKGNEIVFKH